MNVRRRPVAILLFCLIVTGSLLFSSCTTETEGNPPEEYPGKGEVVGEKAVEQKVYEENIVFLSNYFDKIEFSNEEIVNESTAESIASSIGYSRGGKFIEATSEWVGEDKYYLDLDITDDTGEVYLLRIDHLGLFSTITDSKGEYVFAAIE